MSFDKQILIDIRRLVQTAETYFEENLDATFEHFEPQTDMFVIGAKVWRNGVEVHTEFVVRWNDDEGEDD